MLLQHDQGVYSGTEGRVGLRPSQTKIKYPQGITDPALLTVDILRTSHMRSPGQINTEVIINLSENGVPSQVFKRLLVEGIRELVDKFRQWEGADAMFNLWMQAEQAGGVLSARRAREARGEARVRGYTNKSPDEMELEDENDDEDGIQSSVPRSTAWWTDYVSGCPSSLEETVMTMLDAGFTPQTSPMLRYKLEKVVNSKIRTHMTKMKIGIQQSCVAFAVPGSP